MVMPYAAHDGIDPPAGWLFCLGQAISRSTYASLFATLGGTWGQGDLSTTFNLPDFRDRALIGSGGDWANGVLVGEKTHTLTDAELAAHNHGGDTGPPSQSLNNLMKDMGGAGNVAWVAGSNMAGQPMDHTHAIPTDGGGQPHNNIPPSAAVQWIIKT